MRKLTIKRSKWYRGNGSMNSCLLVPEGRDEEDVGKMCCLGFYCRAIGLPTWRIEGFDSPANIEMEFPKSAAWLLDKEPDLRNTKYDNSDDCAALMKMNDDEDMDEAKRETKIAEAFLRHDVEVVFVE